MVHAAAARNNRAKNENASWPMADALFSLAIKFHGAYQLLALRLAWPIPWIFIPFPYAGGKCVKRAKTATETMAICKQQPA